LIIYRRRFSILLTSERCVSVVVVVVVVVASIFARCERQSGDLTTLALLVIIRRNRAELIKYCARAGRPYMD